MPRVLVAFVALVALLLPARASAQPTQKLHSLTTSGTITANGGSVEMLNTGGLGSLRVQSTGTYTGTWEVQCSVAPAGATPVYDTDDEVNLSLEGATAAPVQSVTDAVAIYNASIAGCTAVKAIATSAWTGTLTLYLSATTTGGSAGGGGGASGNVAVTDFPDNEPVNIAQMNGTAVTMGNGASGTGVQRVTIANDSTGILATVGTVTSLSQLAGQAINLNAGNAAAGTQRVVLASDQAQFGGAAAAMADDTANPTVGKIAAYMMCFDGTTWDRCQTTRDPCDGSAKTVIPINISTETTTELTPSLAGASMHYYVCSINLGPTAGAQNLALTDDDSDGCGSVTSGLAGGTTAGTGWNFAANGGLVLGNGSGTVAKTNGTNRVLCAVTSAAVQISGVMTVVAAP